MAAKKKPGAQRGGRRLPKRGVENAGELLESFREPLGGLMRWSGATGVRYAVVGGVAVGVRGRPRATADIDIVVLAGSDAKALLAAMSTFGFTARVSDAIDIANRTRVLLLRHQTTATPVDVMLGMLPYEEQIVAEATTSTHEKLAIPVITVESLCVMKLLARRLQDIADLDVILFTNPSLDRERVLRDMQMLSNLLEEPELLAFSKSFLDAHPPVSLEPEPPPR